jgi:hypothetical protein
MLAEIERLSRTGVAVCITFEGAERGRVVGPSLFVDAEGTGLRAADGIASKGLTLAGFFFAGALDVLT